MKATIDVGICLDRHVTDAAMVLLASIKAHARVERPVRVFLIGETEAADFAGLARSMNDAEFTLVPLHYANPLEHLPVRDYLTAALYLRLRLPALLPQVDRILYLDVDTVVHRDLEALFDIDLGTKALAAVPDWPMLVGSETWPSFAIPYEGRRLRFAAYAREALGFGADAATPYFNSGVLLMDLATWRRDDIAGLTLALLAKKPGFYYPDQDALNAFFQGEIVALDARWNAQVICTRAQGPSPWDWTRAGRRWRSIRKLWRADPWIVHYAGPNKPWVPGQAKTPRDDLWWRYAALSPMRSSILSTYQAGETRAQRRRSKVPRALLPSLKGAPS